MRLPAAFALALLAAAGTVSARSPEAVTARAPEQGDVPPQDDKGLLRGPAFDVLDHSKNEVYLVFAEGLQIVDSVLSGGEEVDDKTFANRMRLSPYATYERGESTRYGLTFDYEAHIHLRRLEKRLKLVIDNGDLSPLPNTQPEEEDTSAQIGLQRQIRRYGSARLGAKIGLPTVGYAIASWGREYHAESWRLRPAGDVFYKTDDNGFGTGYNFRFGRWWGRTMLKSSSGIRITESTEGFEWASALSLARAVRLIEPSKPKPLISPKDLNEGLDLTYRISGHISGSKTVDEHRVILSYRYPIRKNWAFLLLSPEIRWRRDDGWAPEHRLRVGIDVLFWGVTR